MNDKVEYLENRIKELEGMLEYYQDYDSLTSVYNKDAFYVYMQTVLDQHPQGEYQAVSLDIEHFKLVNDIFGVQQGDAMLQALAKKLKSILDAENMCVARVSADRFLAFMPKENSDILLHRMQHALDDHILDMDIVIAIGVYVIVDRTISVRLMCDRAVIAGNSIKGDYQHHVAWFRDEMRNVLIEEQELLNGVENSLKNGEFEVYIQPKCNMQTGKICGGEALVRWNHPIKGMIPPKDFIPIFEKNGFIKQLDIFVWEETAKWLHEWIETGHEAVPISVNVSRIDITNLDIFTIFNDLIKRYQLDPSMLELEITESAYSSRSDEIIYIVNEMMKGGFTVLMDDFGSGYSSLNLLNDISIDVLKLDMRFLDKDDKKSRDILESVIHMAKWLNLKIIAEGVESYQQVDFLLGIGVRFAQGFYYYQPMPIAEFVELIRDPEKVEFGSEAKYQDKIEWLRFKDLMHEDIMSEQMLNHILGAVAVYSLKQDEITILRGNEAYFQLIDVRDINQPYHHNVRNILSEADYEKMLQAMREAQHDGEGGSEVIVQRYRKDNEVLFVQIRIFYLSESNRTHIYYASLTDVSEAMRAQDELRLSLERFRIAMESTSDTIFELDVKTRRVMYNEKIREMYQLPAYIEDAPYGFLRHGIISPAQESEFCELYEAIYRGDKRASTTVQLISGDGKIRWNHITFTAIKDQNGKTVKAVGMSQDVTKEMELKELLMKQESIKG